MAIGRLHPQELFAALLLLLGEEEHAVLHVDQR
jgi:hypothetical protein